MRASRLEKITTYLVTLPLSLTLLLTLSPFLPAFLMYYGPSSLLLRIAYIATPSHLRSRWLLSLAFFALLQTAKLAYKASFRVFPFLRTLVRSAMARMYRLSPPATPVIATRNISIPLGDGVLSSASLFLPDVSSPALIQALAQRFPHPEDAAQAARDGRFPVVLIRTPYDRANLVPAAYIFAERGFAVVTQDARGRADSGGDFFPIANERDDSGATLEWIARRDWCAGSVGMFGVSYMGMVSWAAVGAGGGNSVLKAVVPAFCSTHLHPVLFANGCPSLELLLKWTYLVITLSAGPKWRLFWNGFFSPDTRYTDATMHLPLGSVDTHLSPDGNRISFIQQGLASPSVDDPFWKDKNALVDFDNPDVTIPPAHLCAGFYDFFLDQQLKDYAAARERQQHVALTIGPFSHWSIFSYRPMLYRNALAWFTQHLPHNPTETDAELDDAALASSPLEDRGSFMSLSFPVRVYILGADRWTRFAAWPPPAQDTPLYTAPNGLLSASPPSGNHGAIRGGDTYVFNPLAPTPFAGGPSFDNLNGGPSDQAAIEARGDVLVYTSVPLGEDITFIGHPTISLTLQSDTPGSTDVVVRITDVDPAGLSINRCETSLRLSVVNDGAYDATTGLTTFTVSDLQVGAIGAMYRTGHRIRVQICSGAHPRLARNLGYGDPIDTATRSVSQTNTILHGAVLHLPVVNAV